MRGRDKDRAGEQAGSCGFSCNKFLDCVQLWCIVSNCKNPPSPLHSFSQERSPNRLQQSRCLNLLYIENFQNFVSELFVFFLSFFVLRNTHTGCSPWLGCGCLCQFSGRATYTTYEVETKLNIDEVQNDNIRNNLENISFKVINPFWQHTHTLTHTHTFNSRISTVIA